MRRVQLGLAARNVLPYRISPGGGIGTRASPRNWFLRVRLPPWAPIEKGIIVERAKPVSPRPKNKRAGEVNTVK